LWKSYQNIREDSWGDIGSCRRREGLRAVRTRKWDRQLDWCRFDKWSCIGGIADWWHWDTVRWGRFNCSKWSRKWDKSLYCFSLRI
jgi:hypothetical protein